MSLRILLVDDNHTFLTAVSQCLAMLPEADVVGQAHSGADALVQAQVLQPDLVLLDIVMPHMTGLEVAAQMQSWAHSPLILFLSLHDNESYRAAARELGTLGLVGKANFVADLMPIITRLAADLAPCQADALAQELSHMLGDRL
ncbi:MAG: response regulator transcription factor [Rhodoferax sp.]|uniref:response regulator transcription factor n=1 Tax=Rhodoferax sp. TaxID=50421 RepID=UPI00262D7274|nr:response regulator transcription factor [Rhodoferax sp.]MDD2882091.1 response regulator transcription factor [Rhodoferax sp.]